MQQRNAKNNKVWNYISASVFSPSWCSLWAEDWLLWEGPGSFWGDQGWFFAPGGLPAHLWLGLRLGQWHLCCSGMEKSRSILASVFFLYPALFSVWSYILSSQHLFFLASSLICRQKREKDLCHDCAIGIQLQRWMVLHLEETWHALVSICIKKIWLCPNLPATVCALYLHRFAKILSRFLLLKAPTPNVFNMNHLHTIWLRCWKELFSVCSVCFDGLIKKKKSPV